MKKLLFIDGPLNGGGAERVLLDALANLDYSKYEVTLLQVVGGGKLINQVPKQVKIIAAWHGYCRSFSVAYNLAQRFGITSLLKHRLQSVLNGQHFDAAISFLEGLPLKCHAMIIDCADKNISWVHVDMQRFHYTADQFRRGEEVAAYNMMDSIVCVANDTQKAFIQAFPTVTAPTTVIYNPIDKNVILEKSKLQSIKNEQFTIAIIGRFSPQKKLDRVPRLAARFKADGITDVKFRFIGDGELRPQLEQQIAELGVGDMIELKGFTENPYPEIAAADLLLSTSGYEGFSLVICEAMCLGTPVVSTSTSGPIEIIDNDKYGLLCDHDDESIYRAVRLMYDDEELRSHYAKTAVARIEQFSPQNFNNKFDKLLN
jgi:glycosyltransferase involved in cell wall biosynthesis